MEELKTENTPVVENVPNQAGSGNGKMMAVLIVVVLVVALGAVVFLYFMGSNQNASPEETSPAVPTKIVEQLTATPVPTQPQSSGSAENLVPLSSGNNPDDILKDLNSTTINSFDSDFTDLQKDASGL